ncbi:hypothetical protein C731_4470 [Mycolicibacterium hassiacum DSM 44199]|uniref:Uncharacterized protein n=1 Tax=Mycolicibacterium hassiacum (strain DSM 44199 / CIP 105218 / JCM 12690 / 3849) TaxID=1122247 RepID=K5BA32_MYCHD|nr:hypothetical protein C731_4470 [Mycolicibacterium hassiacum DSM 44199]
MEADRSARAWRTRWRRPQRPVRRPHVGVGELGSGGEAGDRGGLEADG